jgi:hypothetical protein
VLLKWLLVFWCHLMAIFFSEIWRVLQLMEGNSTNTKQKSFLLINSLDWF